MSLFDDLVSILFEEVDSFILYFILPVVLFLLILYAAFKLRELKYKMLVAKEGFYSTKKMEMQMKKLHLEELAKAALVLNEKEKEKLVAMDAENALQAQREIFLRNEIEKLKQQSLHWNEIAELSDMLGKYKEQIGIFREAGKAPIKKPGLFRKKKKR